MAHHREENTELLTPSGIDDDLSFLTQERSEPNLASSSATLPKSPVTPTGRILLRGTPVVMAGLLFGAALTAGLHHAYLCILRGRIVSGQFWIKNSSNALSTLVQLLCTASVSLSLTQLIWWLIRRRPLTVLQLNHLFGIPNPLPIVCLASSDSKRPMNIIPIIIMATLVQAFALVSILAPNSLEVGPPSPKNTNISVPTIFFDKPEFSVNYGIPSPSPETQKVLSLAFQSDTLIGWNAPPGCGTACNYTIQYPAPALRCTELNMDDVNAMLPIMDVYQRTVYNATQKNVLAYIAPMFMAWVTNDANGNQTAAGTRCSLYNTTQQSVVSFVNNTGTISPRIVSYDSPINVDPNIFMDAHPESDSSNDITLSFYTYIVVARWLYIRLQGYLTRTYIFNGSSSTVGWFQGEGLNLASSNLFLLNETAGTFTANSGNVVSALEQTLVNITVALITSWGHTTMVNASVVQDGLVWVYHGQRLWIIYATALGLTAACGAAGLACILKNGKDSDLTFWDIVRATRNSELDAVVEEEKRGNTVKDTMLQYAAQTKDLEANISGVFVLARSPHKDRA